ncbi:hypothetical protein Tco_1404692 [Tanacetum coccineum]
MSDHNSFRLSTIRLEMSVEMSLQGLVPKDKKASDYENLTSSPDKMLFLQQKRQIRHNKGMNFISSTGLKSGESSRQTFGKMIIKLKVEEGIDFEESFAPVARLEAVRIFVAKLLSTSSKEPGMMKFPTSECSKGFTRSPVPQKYPKDYGFGLKHFRRSILPDALNTCKVLLEGYSSSGDKLVSWMSKKQNCTAMSSIEACSGLLSAVVLNHKVVRLGINPMIQPEPEDLLKDNPKLEIAVLRFTQKELGSTGRSSKLVITPREDLVKLWSLVKEKFTSTEPTKDKEREIWVELKILFEPDTDDSLWKLQKHIHDITWILYDTCGVHHVSTKDGMDIYMLVEREYPLSRGVLTQMLVAKLLVEQDNEMSRELLRKIFMQVERPRR